MSVIGKLLGGSAGGVIKEITSVVDKYVTTPEDKAKIQAEIEKTISDRWKADMESDSWLSKNVRPLTLIVVIATLVILTFFSGAGLLEIDREWIGLWEMVSITVIGGYFAVRSVDKRGRVK